MTDGRRRRAARPSNHVEPHGTLQVTRHYVRDLVYGANDGIITTFAVVAGVVGGGLSTTVVLVCGVANLLADGLSMAVSNYLAIRSHEGVLEAQGLPEEEAFPFRHGLATFLAFVAAGTLPLLPYLVPGEATTARFFWSIGLALGSMFVIGAMRGLVANISWLAGGLEMFGLGLIVTLVAYGSGWFVSSLLAR